MKYFKQAQSAELMSCSPGASVASPLLCGPCSLAVSQSRLAVSQVSASFNWQNALDAKPPVTSLPPLHLP